MKVNNLKVFKCPVDFERVTLEYCDSFCEGKGCKFRLKCSAYVDNISVKKYGELLKNERSGDNNHN